MRWQTGKHGFRPECVPKIRGVVDVNRKALALLSVCSLFCTTAMAQSNAPTLQGTWKYLRNFTYVQVDERNRVFQCRIMPDLHVLFSTGQISDGGAVVWTPVRFFSLYGKEFVPSGMDWGTGAIELRNRVMFLTAATPSGSGTERLEFDKVPELPVMCAYYLETAFE
jgi:hypothetical protein